MKTDTIMLLGLLTTLSACNHKDLDVIYPDAGNVSVVFDWRNAPDANPESMEACFFDVATTTEPVRFIFNGRDGGTIHIPYGEYSVIGLNGDINDWACRRNDHDIDRFEIYTPDAECLSGFGLDARTLPRARAAEDERMAQTPGTLYSNRRDNISLAMTPEEQTVTLYPEEVTCHYTVSVRDVENIRNLNGATIDATLSGLAEGFLHGANRSTSVPVTMPFTLNAERDENTLRGSFLTFGECPGENFTHSLVVYMVFTDGTQRYQTFDVTDQIRNAPDPHNVDIIVSGLKIPRLIDAGGGFNPDVDAWEAENIDLKM